MAIMTRCCCCDVRAGSMVVAVWTMIATVGSLIQSARAWAAFDNLGTESRSLYAVYGVMIGINSLLLIAAVCLTIGVGKDKKELLLPYMVVQPLLLLGYLVLEIGLVVVIANGSFLNFDIFDMDLPTYTFNSSEADIYEQEAAIAIKVVLIGLAVAIPCAILLELMCLFCVISQYQELRDGRGRGIAIPHTVIIQHTGYTTGFAPPTYDPNPACQPSPQQYYNPHGKC